jgi:tRNA nucleotidyltransferase (CCA-adding enzyme)
MSEKQKDDVRILKAFLKSHNIYGAEAKIEGFSGYLCELLILHYGSFLNLITGISNIGLPLIIDIAKKNQKDSKEIIKQFEKTFVVIDPTDSNRNVAANVSEESLFRLVLISRNILRSPNKLSFYGKGHSDTYSKRNLLKIKDMLGSNLYVLHFNVPEIANDIIWQQLKRTKTRLDELLKKNGFEPIVSVQNTDDTNAVIGFFIDVNHIKSTKIIGPPLGMGDAVEKFIASHKNSILSIENDRIYSIEKSRYENPEALIRSFLKDKSTYLPSYIKQNKSKLYLNSIPERYAKLIFSAYSDKYSI